MEAQTNIEALGLVTGQPIRFRSLLKTLVE
jgi:hypothetical protein